METFNMIHFRVHSLFLFVMQRHVSTSAIVAPMLDRVDKLHGHHQTSAPKTTGAVPTCTEPRQAHSLEASGEHAVVVATRALNRAVSGFWGIPNPEPTLLCQICFENVPHVEMIELSSCHHLYCRPCLKRYLELKIQEGNIFPKCFHPVERSTTINGMCDKRIDDTQLQSIVDQETWAKCTLFRFNKANANARECPFCYHPQQCNGPQNPHCTCTQCGRDFCYFHGNAHTNGTCAEYEHKNANSEKETRAIIAQVTKPCPGCNSNVEKSGGCNHMTCIMCQTGFCWICNDKLERNNVTEHYMPGNRSRCSGQQFDEVAINDTRSFWARFSQLHWAVHTYTTWFLYHIMNTLTYPLAILLALLVVGAMRIFPNQALYVTPFSVIIQRARPFFAITTTSIAFVFIVLVILPTPVLVMYIGLEIVRAYGD